MSDRHLRGAVGGVALGPGVVIVRGLGRVLPLAIVPVSRPSVHAPVGLTEEIRHVLYAPLPPGGIGVPPAGVVYGGGVAWDGGLPLDVAGAGLPRFKGRAGEQRVRDGFGDACVLQVAAGNGDGQRGAVVVVRHREGLVEV